MGSKNSIFDNNLCILCGKKIKFDEPRGRHGNHLICDIEEEGGCYNERGDFLACNECWSPCPFRQDLPINQAE